jgi:hypothetical protein
VAQRLDERRAEGAEWRRQVPLSAQAEWKAPADRADPVGILIGQGRTLIAELLPIRYARMKTDPFAFLRGAAAIMAADLASGPTTGLRVQACGDCHLANFGAYASPEGTPVFDVNDFDETLPAPFEWDVKRLAASLAVAGRVAGAPDREARLLARIATKNYRHHLGQLALLSPLEAWSSRIDLVDATADADSPKIRRNIERRRAAALQGAAQHYGLVERRTAIGGSRTSRHWCTICAITSCMRIRLSRLCRDIAGGSARPVTALPSSRRRVQDRRSRQHRHILCHRALRVGRRCAPTVANQRGPAIGA